MTRSSLQHAIDNITWYHDFDFGNGLRATSSVDNVDAIRPVWRFIEQQLDRIDFRGKSVLEVVDIATTVEAGQQCVARIRVLNNGSCKWTALPAPNDYESMFLGDQTGAGGEEPPGVQKYRHYIESNGLQGMVTVGVHLSSDVGGGVIQHDYARGFLPSDVLAGQACEVTVVMRAPLAPGVYALTFDVVDEYVTWFSRLGSRTELEYIAVGGVGVSPDSRAPGVLRTQFLEVQFPGASIAVVSIRNCGDTVWLKGPLSRGGHVQVGVQRLDVDGKVQDRDWMRVGLPHTVLAGDTVVVRLDLSDLASHPDTAQIKIDLIAESRCWFEDAGSPPLVLDLGSVL